MWERGRDQRYEIAVAGIGPGTTLGFFCSAYQVPNTAIISLSNLILGPQLPDGKNFDLRFVIDGVKYDLPGIAKDGELLVSPADANMELRVQEVTEALRTGKQAQIAVPAQGVEIQAAARRRRPGARRRVRGVLVGTFGAASPTRRIRAAYHPLCLRLQSAPSGRPDRDPRAAWYRDRARRAPGAG